MPETVEIVKRIEHQKALTSGISVSGPLRTIPDNEWLSSPRLSGRIPEPYSSHAWVYAAIRSISINLAGVPLSVLLGSLEKPKVVGDQTTGKVKELWDILNQPNRFMSGNALIDATVVNLNNDGMCFWFLDRNNVSEVPKEIVPFRRAFFEPAVDTENGSFDGWFFVDPRKGTRGFVAHHQVVVYRFYDPFDPLMGLAPLDAAARGIVLDYFAHTYNQAFFENSAVPDALITYDRQVSNKQRKEIQESFEQRHRGAHNAKKIGVISGGGKYQPLAGSHKDMEFSKQKELTRQEILAAFKVPETEISMYQNVAHANATSQNKAFWNKTLIPIARNIEMAMKVQLIKSLESTLGRGLRVVFDFASVPALQEDLSEKIKNAERLYRIGYPINEISRRLQLDMDDVDWGDNWYPNGSVRPIDQIIEGEEESTPSGPSEGSDPEKPENKPQKPEDFEPDEDQEDNEEGEGKILYQRYLKPAAGKMVVEVRTLMYKMRAEVLKGISDDDYSFDIPKWEGKYVHKVSNCFEGMGQVNRFFLDFIVVSDKSLAFNRNIRSFLELISENVNKIKTADISERAKRVRVLFNSLRKTDALHKFCVGQVMSVMMSMLSLYKRAIGNEKSARQN